MSRNVNGNLLRGRHHHHIITFQLPRVVFLLILSIAGYCDSLMLAEDVPSDSQGPVGRSDDLDGWSLLDSFLDQHLVSLGELKGV